MLIDKLNIKYFGRFHNKEIDLKPGINLLYGENEAGKSTLHTFIKGMLFGLERMRGRASASKEDLYTKYLPWEYPGAYGGSMDIRVGEKRYRLQRSFHANDKSFTVMDLSTGREVPQNEDLISELVPGLTESAFQNTVSMSQQKARTDAELALQVSNYIANLSISKSKEVNVTKAVSILTEKRRQLQNSINTALMEELSARIEDGLAKEEKQDRLSAELHALMSEEQKLAKQRESLAGSEKDEMIKRMEQLPAILEKFQSYQELSRQEEALEKQSRELQTRILQWEKDKQSMEVLTQDIRKTATLHEELMELERVESELQAERDHFEKAAKKNLFVSFLPCCFIATVLLFVTGFRLPGIILSAILFAVEVSSYILLNRRSRKKQKQAVGKGTGLGLQKVAILSELEDIFKKNRVTGAEGLTIKQEELKKQEYALEHTREQLRELEVRKRETEDSRDIVYDVIMKYLLYFVPAEELSQDTIQRLQEEIQRKKQETSDKAAAINQQQEDLRVHIEKIKWELSSLEGNEEQLIKDQELCKEQEQKQREAEVELEAIKLALTSIQELSADIHDSFGQQINQAASTIIKEVTNRKYADLKVDEKLEVKVEWNGNYILLDRFSAGTIDQIYLALRLAVADLLIGSDEMPLLLDDSFALYDDDRTKAALQMVAGQNQILLFTCHKREKEMLKEMELPYHYIDLSCR